MSTEPIITPETHDRAKRYAANKLNALLSTGPKTPEGKKRSSLNGLTHGLTAVNPLLPHEDPEVFAQHCRDFHDEYQPKTATERQLTRDLAETSWRLNRIPALEASVLALEGPLEPGSINTDVPNLEACLAITETLRRQERCLDTLSKHHTRLSRHFHKTIAELRALQADRKKKEKDEIDLAARMYFSYIFNNGRKEPLYDPRKDGFAFSLEQVQQHWERLGRADRAIQDLMKHKKASAAAH